MPTVKHPTSGDVRVIPDVLTDRYLARGWEQTAADPAPPAPPPDPRPTKAASKDAWVEFAMSQGVASYEAHSATKDELIEMVG